MAREVVVVSAGVRTAIGTFGGSLKDIPPTELAARWSRSRSRAPMWKARTWAMWCLATSSTPSRATCTCRAWPPSTAAARGNPGHQRQPPVRLGAAGHRQSSSQSIQLGDYDVAIGGGCRGHEPRALRQPEHALGFAHGRHQDGGHDGRRAARPLPHHPHGCDGRKRGQGMGHHPRRPGRAGAGKPPARRKSLGRGRFKGQIVPVMLKSKKGEVAFDKDEHFRPGCHAGRLDRR
jgi:acetyl-CoA C-acetyltransferase